MSYQTRIRTKKSSFIPPAAKFSPPPVLQPKAEKKPDAKLPEWKPGGGGAVSPLQRLIDSKAAQAKLTIGEPNDKYEQEADAVAKQVVQRLHSPVSESPQPETVQRETLEAEQEDTLQMKPMIVQRVHAVGGSEAASPEIENSINRAKGSGQPLDASLQRSMGEAMGADFSGVRVHTDTHADRLNQSIQAKAFTTGQDVFFRQGAYQPGSRGGQELIAHELTHVVQQGTGLGIVQRQLDLANLPSGTINKKSEFGELLTDHHGYKLFLNYCEQEFCPENLLFLKAVSEYKKNHGRKRAIKIAENFLFSTAPQEVNLPNSTKKKMLQEIAKYQKNKENSSFSVSRKIKTLIGMRQQQGDVNLFDEAAMYVSKEIDTDTFGRFKETKEYKEWKEKREQQRIQSEKLRELAKQQGIL